VHILVCIKQVLDQDIPPRSFRLDPVKFQADVPGAARAMSAFDANALEVALQLRDAVGAGSTVTALSLGSREAEDVLRKALEVTADAAMLVLDARPQCLDPAGVALVIAAAVRRFAAEGNPVNLVLAGRQAGDWEHGQTGGMIAENLCWPCLTFVSRLRPGNGLLEARREVEDGHEIIEARLPLVVTVTNAETNRLRLPRVRDVMRAHRAPLLSWEIPSLGLSPERLTPWTEVAGLVIPERRRRCELIEGETPEDQAVGLARRLRALQLL
jgi:electron transfer flavoprotein beta subunit